MAGTLYILATPIGNLKDITLRAIEKLTEASVIIAEDTRRCGRLLKHYGLPKKSLLSCHRFNEKSRIDKICDLLSNGSDVVLVSDSGTPGISDPGALVVNGVQKKGFSVLPVPGPSALTAAVSVAGIGEKGFVFIGFPGKKTKDMIRICDILETVHLPVVFYESPHRILKTLGKLKDLMPRNEIVLCREMTKLHEEILKGSVSQIWLELQKRKTIKGEIVVIVTASHKKENG